MKIQDRVHYIKYLWRQSYIFSQIIINLSNLLREFCVIFVLKINISTLTGIIEIGVFEFTVVHIFRMKSDM